MKLTKSTLKRMVREELLKEQTITDPMHHDVHQRTWQIASFAKNDLNRIIKHRGDNQASKMAKQIQGALKKPIDLMKKLEQYLKDNPQ